jgi:nucleoside-diphosphate-sugar epimerase
LVYTSSGAVYGVPESNPVTELSPKVPGEDYGRSKLQAEQLCERMRGTGVPVSIIRPRTILGSGRLGIFQILFDWVSEGYNVPVFNGGGNRYQFVHADDLADACIRAAMYPGNEDFNIGSDRFGTMRELLEALCRHAGTGSKVKSLPMRPIELGMKVASGLGLSPLGPYHALMYGRSLYFDVNKAKSLLGWSPQYSSEEMIIESYEYYLKNREEILGQTQGSPHRSAVKQRILGLVKHVL